MRAAIVGTVVGPYGQAHELARSGDFDTPDMAATLAFWFLHCPGQSPAWADYILAVIHLRPIDGQSRPPVIKIPGATHELMVMALDPTRSPVPEDTQTWHHLRPVNVVEQVQLPGDDAAVELARLAAKSVVAGVLWAEPPLAGQIEPWHTALVKTSAHLRGEEHAP